MGESLVGRTLKDAYLIRALLGEGAMGAVYRAVQLTVGREVAIKTLNMKAVAPVAAERAAQRFRREAMATSRLSHPNTVRLIDFGEADGGLLFLVLELLDGEPLGDLLDRVGRLGYRRTARVGHQIAKSLSEAHAFDIVHRDLKPDNVFLCTYDDEPDFVKVLDFGIARIVDREVFPTRMTQENTTVGSPVYMSPEQADGKDTTPASDLYSLGVVLQEMLTGDPPFQGGTFLEVALKHVAVEPPPIAFGDDVPEPVAEHFQDLIDRLLAKEPADRPRSAREVADELENIQDLARISNTQIPVVSLRTMPRTDHGLQTLPEAETSPKRRKWGFIPAAALLLAGAVVAVLLATGGGETPPEAAAPIPQVRPEPVPPAAAKDEAVVENGHPEEKKLTVEAERVRLELSSEPDDATVTRAGEALCTTPCDVELPASGEPAKLVISKPGCTTAELEIPLEPGTSLERAVRLEPVSDPPD